MPLVHRKVPLAPFVADPEVAVLQGTASPQPGAFPGIVIPIITSGAAKILWWGILRASDAPDAPTIDATGFAFDAQLVATVAPVGVHAPDKDIVAWDSIFGGTGGLATNGHGLVEADVPFAISGSIRVISVAGVPVGTPFLWLSFETSVLRSD